MFLLVYIFAIEVVPRNMSSIENSLAIVVSTLEDLKELSKQNWKVEVIIRSSMPDNQENWHLFNDDAHIIHFIKDNGEGVIWKNNLPLR